MEMGERVLIKCNGNWIETVVELGLNSDGTFKTRDFLSSNVEFDELGQTFSVENTAWKVLGF